MQQWIGWSLAAAILVVGALSSFPANARAIRCEGCSDAQFLQAAINAGEGKHVVTSLSTGKMKGFEVFVEAEPESHYGTYYAVNWQLPAEYWEIFDVARDFYVMSNGSMSARIVVDGNDLGVQGLHNATIYDIMSDYSLRGRLGDRLYNEPLPFGEVRDENGTLLSESSVIARALEQLRKIGFAQLGISDGSIEVVVVTAYGGFVVYRISQDVGTGQYLEGRSRTPDGHPVPEDNAKEYAGTYLGESGNLTRLSQFMGSYLGASMSSEGSGIYMHSLTCSWRPNGNGGTLSCVREYRNYPTAPR